MEELHKKFVVSVEVVIVGAGPAGLAAAACLNRQGVSNVVLERDDCCGSLWKKRSYDRLSLHLAKQFCALPHMPFPDSAPRFVPRGAFANYLDSYAARFRVAPLLGRAVQSAFFEGQKWRVVARNSNNNEEEVYVGRFLVAATGENGRGFVPAVKGLEGFGGVFVHSSKYVNGKGFGGKEVLVVGAGNSGMEIAYDLSNYNANASISVRSPVHVLTRDIVFMGMLLLKYLPVNLVDAIVLVLAKLRFGNISDFGLKEPKLGPFFLKAKTGRSPTIDVGCMDKIKTGDIKVFPSITSIEGNKVKFDNGEISCFDAIIFATGYRSTVKTYLKDEDNMFDDQGMPKARFPNHWKGKNGLYCAGFARRGLSGISADAENIAKDITYILNTTNYNN